MSKAKRKVRRVVCPECDGDGGEYPYTCGTCDGDGYVTPEIWYDKIGDWGGFDDQFNNE